ncbi:MAG: metalloregulator ArsR/SmtB family transcription factor [Patescibacteria group bacterium]|nr:metalloregulator ArsR/SmtB family transcription factor [Patescibacteria group bacterium]
MDNNVLSTLSNPIRLKLITCLTRKPKSVSEMIAICGLSQSAVSQHLSKLRLAGLVTTEKRGKTVYYSLVHSQSAKVSSMLQKFVQEVAI